MYKLLFRKFHGFSLYYSNSLFLVISESVQVLTLIVPYHHQLEPIIPQRVIKLLFCNP